MLSKKQTTNNNHQHRSKFVTVIHPDKLTSIANSQENSIREYLVSWLFLIGSLMFLFDGILELTEGISIHGLIHIVASILFTIGSILFIPTNKQ